MIDSEVQGEVGIARCGGGIAERAGCIYEASSGGMVFERVGVLKCWYSVGKVDSRRRRRVLIKKLLKAIN